MLCKFLQTYTGITQDNRVAEAAPVPVPAAMLISLTPSPQLQSGDMPTEPRRAACHTGVETRLGCRSQPTGMHTKREVVCTYLPEAIYDLDGGKSDST